VFASARAELLVLRKWPAAWGLLLVTPALALLGNYVLDFVLYLTVTPAQYQAEGSPTVLLSTLLPSQFLIVSVQLFYASNVVPFVVLGAVLAGGDWGRGTITTSLLAAPGRIRAGAGQALALAVAVTASVAATFAVSAAASLVFRALEAKEVNPVDGAMPPAWVLLRAMGALLVALTYAALGWLLGTACRSAAGGIALALVWAVLIETYVSYFGIDYTGLLPKVSDFLPGTNAITVTGLFGDVGGGPTSQNYLPDRPGIAAWALVGWTAAFVALTLILLHRRDVLAGRVRRRQRRPAALTRPQVAVDTAMPPPRRAGGSPHPYGPSCWSSATARSCGGWCWLCQPTC
jgi:ABC-2 type transport system permease protein